jgi:glucose-6-phosphate-specific signal transduction histidine kinase
MQISEPRRFQITAEFLKEFPRQLWGLVLNPIGFTLTSLGILMAPRRKEFFLFYAWLGAAFLMAWVLPQKILDHPFYLLPLLPPAAWFSAVALEKFPPRSAFPILGLFLAVSLHYAVGPLYHQLPKAPLILDTAQNLKKTSQPSDTLMVVDPVMPYALLYYADRKGWTFFSDPEEIEEKASYYVRGDKKSFNQTLRGRYPVVFENEDFLVFDLRSPAATPSKS